MSFIDYISRNPTFEAETDNEIEKDFVFNKISEIESVINEKVDVTANLNGQHGKPPSGWRANPTSPSQR